MLNKLLAFVRQQNMIRPGDGIVCAVSGGADSIALLFAMHLLKEKLDIHVSAAHFNHNLRGAESDKDETFVREFCHRYDIPLTVGAGKVTAGKKGLEAAAREARYAFLKRIPGKIATAHTADDNAETVLMHMVRGTGLKGLGGITPVADKLIRPMLTVTREEVLAFLDEYHLSYVQDSSNDTDAFLRNRLRHHVMPLLRAENPKLAENMSAMALRLRDDEATLAELSASEDLPDVFQLQKMPIALRRRAICAFLERAGVGEPEAEHIALVEKLVFSSKPSAKASLPNGVCIVRCYDRLQVATPKYPLNTIALACPGITDLPDLGLRVICSDTGDNINKPDAFSVCAEGGLWVRARQAGDSMRLSGGTKDLKKLFIDRKIPAQMRSSIPVIIDDKGVLGVCGIGANQERTADSGERVLIKFEQL